MNNNTDRTIELRDGDALEILADKWRKANGGSGTLVGGLLKETGRPIIFTPATVANMRAFIEHHESDAMPPMAIAVSLNGPEQYSASPGDYFDRDEDEALTDEDGEPMILAVKSELHGLRDALTGAPIHV